jgi:hypothetical protein
MVKIHGASRSDFRLKIVNGGQGQGTDCLVSAWVGSLWSSRGV